MMKRYCFIIAVSLVMATVCGCSAAKSEENVNVGAINPWVDVNADQATQGMTNPFKAPEGAQDEHWQTFVSNDPSEQEVKFVQLLFTMDGTQFCAREYEGTAEDKDIAGMYFNWAAVEDDRLSNWGNDGITCKSYSYVRDENDPNDSDAMLVEWYDPENSIKYSLSATGEDLNGLDIVALADMMRDN